MGIKSSDFVDQKNVPVFREVTQTWRYAPYSCHDGVSRVFCLDVKHKWPPQSLVNKFAFTQRTEIVQ